MLSTIVRMHKGEIIDNGLCKAFLSINEPPWIAVFGRVTVVESAFDIQVHVASGDLLVFAGEVRRFDGKDVVLVQYLTSFLSCQFVHYKPSLVADGQLELRQRPTKIWSCR